MSPDSSLSCSRCGAAIPPGSHFCASCGLDISSPQGGVTTLHVAPVASQRADLADLLRQTTLGEYEILAELGRGGMATVYLAHDIALGRKVAIKVMSPALFSGEGMAERFKREARTAAQLSHPHIIPIYSVQENGDLLFFVMKFIEGRPLDSIIKEVGPLPIAMVRTILMQVGGALGYAHRRGVIHRDIKPANIMLDADGWAIVTDFGIAKVSETQGLTVTGATVGTPSYMSPEQCAAQELTGATDQYSLGVVAYEMLSGKLPFIAESVMAVMYAHFNQPPRPVVQIRADCPVELAATVMRMLEKDPGQRFPNMEAATAAMGSVNLSPDDPVRTQMMTLAAAGENSKLLARFSTPVSQPSMARSAATASRRTSIAVLAILPARVTVAVGDAVQLRASAKTRNGQTLLGRPVSWASTNTDVALVSETGMVTAIAPGTVTITASSADTSATATVTVAAASRRRGKIIGLVGGGVAVAAVAGWLLLSPPWRGHQQPPARGTTDTTPHPPSTGIVDTPIVKPQPPVAIVDSPTHPAGRTGTTTPRNRPQPPPDSSEATVATALASARSARDRAVATGAAAADLAGGDAELQEAQGLRQPGHRAEAFDRLRAAVVMFGSAESSAAAARLAAQQRKPPADTATKPPPPPVEDPKPRIFAAIVAYGQALESRDVGSVKAIYPGISRQEADVWRDFFGNAKNIHATLMPALVSLSSSGDEAEVAVKGVLTYQRTNPPGQPSDSTNFHARLELKPAGWVITAIDRK